MATGHSRHAWEQEDRRAAEATAAPDVAVEPPLPSQRPLVSPWNAPLLQRVIGNAALARLVGPQADEKVGDAVFHGADAEHDHGAPEIGKGELNEFGELTGEVDTGVAACLFIDGGKVGEGKVYWSAGGDGGQGQQNVGSVDLVAPEYEGSDASGDQPAKAWIKDGTGTVTVTRTFKGVRLGDNGEFYFTAAAVARADVHEKLHVASSKAIHDARLAPLEQRIKKHKGAGQALSAGTKKDEAIDALKTFVNWNDAVQKFQTEDAAANQGGGTTDTLDMARPDFVVNYGPQTVNGVAYANYIDMKPGPQVTPTPAGGQPATAGAGSK